MQRLSILVADDEAGIRELFRRVLTSHGHDVFCAENGMQALSLLTNHEIDVVYLDIRMPDGNGLMALKKIHTLWPSLPVIMITGCAQSDVIDATMKLGAEMCLVKPFGINDILAILEVVRAA